ncbi:efflux transporter outer membrane subunit [Desulfoplanes formicivorans]|uniref:efflux transporter outer membrane subunit n=1 Tax=Desulfoplanes formicivorans TaxID=1592317 RepID=UPI000853E46C|nr:efflux transporter outer membrane subunit [Desulfoplanes formicivorans]
MKNCLWIAFILLAGCSLSPSYHRPVQDIPVSWENRAGTRLEEQWWQRFNDPVLNGLVERALEHNLDLATSFARLEQAAAAVGLSRSDLAPTPSLDGSGSQTWTSTRIYGAPPPGSEEYSNHDIYVGAAWELDFWGKYRNALQSGQAAFLATAADVEAIRLLIAGTTVKAYFALLSAEFQIRIAEKTLEQRLQAFEFYEVNEKFGFYSKTDLLRAKSEVEDARYTLAVARMDADSAHSALLLLLGRSPSAIFSDSVNTSTSLDLLPVVPVLPDGLPSELLMRRPDLRSAEQLLQAAHFDVGVVRADYFPSISLTGQSGLAAMYAGDLTQSGAESWTYGLSIHLPLDFWRTRFREQMAEAKCREAAADYDKAVQSAFRDIRDALNRQARLAEASDALERQVKDLKEAVIKADDRYRNGYSNFLDVLDADRSHFAAQLAWARTRTQQLNAMVDVCLALGGGWTGEAASSSTQSMTTGERANGGSQ